LVGASGWTALELVRIGSAQPALLVATVGSTALSLGPLLWIARHAAPPSETTRAFVRGAVVCVGPLTLLARVLRAHTHHRALGGVTFALVAFMLVLLAAAVMRRLRTLEHEDGVASRIASAAFPALVVASLASAIVLSGSAARLPSAFLVDLLLAALTFVASLSVRRRWAPAWERAGLVAWFVVVLAGIGVTLSNLPVRSLLRERAPIALGLLSFAR
jgi:hypothetical protein